MCSHTAKGRPSQPSDVSRMSASALSHEKEQRICLGKALGWTYRPSLHRYILFTPSWRLGGLGRRSFRPAAPGGAPADEALRLALGARQ